MTWHLTAQLSGSLLRRSVSGRNNIRKAVHAVGTLYVAQKPIFFGTIDDRAFLQYEATLHNGLEVQVVAIIDRNTDGSVRHVNVTLGPIDALLSIAGRLGTLLENELGRDLFL